MRLLLDAPVAPALARELRRHGVDALALVEWQDGAHRTVSDEQLLALAFADRRVLASYDCRTIPPLLRELAETGGHHAGVILVDSRTYHLNDVGGLLAALRTLAAEPGDDWEDRAIFLVR